MKYLESYKVFEKSIGVQNIYKKHYSDIKPELFKELINLDPTTTYFKNVIDGSDKGKLGKYTKWILREYRKGYFDSYIKDNDIKKLKFLREELTLLGTSWLKKRMGKSIDILKYSYPELTNLLSEYLDKYKKETFFDEESGVSIDYDLLFEDDKWMIFVPLNWQTSQYLCGKDTQWCSNTQTGWVYTKGEGNILYRFIPKGYGSKMRLTWMGDKSKYNWAFAYTKSVYHLRGDGNPFENDGDVYYEEDKEIHDELLKQISNIHPDAKKEVLNYHKKVNI